MNRTDVFAATRDTPPQGPPPKPFQLAATTDFTLPNGMQVTMVPYGIVPKVAVRLFVGAGAIDESAAQVWLSKLTAAFMKEGTGTRSAEQVAREAAEMGGQVETGASSDFSSVGGVALSDFGPKFVALLADVLTAASLPAAELPRLKADLLRDLSIEKSQPESLARERFLATLFPNHPYGRAYPSESGLQGYAMENVQAFYGENFCAARTHLYIAGKLEGDLHRVIEDAFGGWDKGTPAPELQAQAVKTRSFQFIDRPGAAQSNLMIGLPVAAPSSPDYIKLDVMDSLLGGSFASRITSNIREDKGYTYSPHSKIGTRRHFAYWMQSADVATDVTGPALHEIFYEIDRLRQDPPSGEELEGIRSYLAGLFILRNTISPDAIIAQLHFVDSQGLDRSYLSTYTQKVMDVKPGDVQGVAETYLAPSKMTIVVVGDKAKIADQIAEYQEATEQEPQMDTDAHR
ncbi:MAG TPA: pitrilysin family protein [Bryobacteraceae bacterium]|nr:pitrilysin family protein [Bryobacteraceae bacterium]